MEVDGESMEKQGCLLLGSPTFIVLGNGRLRCEETGHDLPAKDKDSYSRTKACRLALIDAALYKKIPPLNTFLPHPLSKSKLVCSLTGDSINKSEEHILKHIHGKRFLKKLDQTEVKDQQSLENFEKDAKKSKKPSKLNAISFNYQRVKAFMPREPVAKSSDSEESDFWIPPVGNRLDFNDQKGRCETCATSDQEPEAEVSSGRTWIVR
ncbi:hypothetical protein KSP39_PZI005348 [Platanthera zijinensis]|uniref:Uncharacterized protein n=1 Tax=Platanthera zijinensis TaxID=2320716 RepID=A0AAP0BUQ6_9ASPA